MANRLIKLRPVSVATSTPEAGDGSAQQVVIPITGLTDGAGVVIDRSENIYVSDYDRHVIFKYRRGSSASSIFIGALDTSGDTNGQGTSARLNKPGAMAIDRRGTIWLIDSGNAKVKRIDENGNVFTVAAIPAEVGGDTPGHIAVDDAENIFLIDNS